MKVLIFTGSAGVGSSARGIGVYTKMLFESLSKLDGIEVTMGNFKNMQNPDIVHYPSFSFFKIQLPFVKKGKTVVTVHDTIPLIYPNNYPAGIVGSIKLQYQTLALRQSDAIIADSETSRKDIVRFLGVSQDKIKVVYLGPTLKRSESAKKELETVVAKYNLPESFVLYVGDVNYNKNLPALCEACVRAKTNLVIVGKSALALNADLFHPENRDLSEIVSKYANSKYVKRVGYVADSELRYFFESASMYCQPSRYEGFGLSVLDAMASGLPVLSSNIQVSKEIWGNHVEYFDVNSIDSLTGKIQELMSSDKKRKSLTESGLKFSKSFSWRKCAEETLSLYQKVLSS